VFLTEIRRMHDEKMEAFKAAEAEKMEAFKAAEAEKCSLLKKLLEHLEKNGNN